jgi:hypothetical protein
MACSKGLFYSLLIVRMQIKQVFILFGTMATLLFTACSNSAKEKNAAAAYKQAEETLFEKEQKSPASFLLVSSTDKHNLIGQTVVKGTIANTARMCVYFDMEIELSYLSKTGTLLMKQNETIYETVTPGNKVKFKAKEFAPKNTDKVLLKIVSAKTKAADPAT